MKSEIRGRFGGVLFTAELDARFSTSSVSVKMGEAAKFALKSGADLRGADLRGADLRGADLRGADLRGAYLRGAYLRGADLRGAYLRGADLGGACRGGAAFGVADVSGAYVGGADLGGADVGGAYLGGADLGGAYLRGAYLGGAYLGGAYLGGAYLGKDKKLPLVGERPLIQLGPIGSRGDYASAFLTDEGIYVVAGCFTGMMASFKERVKETHGENPHGLEYRTFIAMVEAHFAIWPAVK